MRRMDDDQRELLAACEEGITQLILAATEAQQRVIAVAAAFQGLPEQLTRQSDGGRFTATAEDVVDSVRTARHAIRDVERIGRCWQQEVGLIRAKDPDPT
jgi:hypothetical protein